MVCRSLLNDLLFCVLVMFLFCLMTCSWSKLARMPRTSKHSLTSCLDIVSATHAHWLSVRGYDVWDTLVVALSATSRSINTQTHQPTPTLNCIKNPSAIHMIHAMPTYQCSTMVREQCNDISLRRLCRDVSLYAWAADLLET